MTAGAWRAATAADPPLRGIPVPCPRLHISSLRQWRTRPARDSCTFKNLHAGRVASLARCRAAHANDGCSSHPLHNRTRGLICVTLVQLFTGATIACPILHACASLAPPCGPTAPAATCFGTAPSQLAALPRKKSNTARSGPLLPRSQSNHPSRPTLVTRPLRTPLRLGSSHPRPASRHTARTRALPAQPCGPTAPAATCYAPSQLAAHPRKKSNPACRGSLLPRSQSNHLSRPTAAKRLHPTTLRRCCSVRRPKNFRIHRRTFPTRSAHGLHWRRRTAFTTPDHYWHLSTAPR